MGQRPLDFLLAGFGWCRMPIHLIEVALAAGRLVPIDIADESTPPDSLAICATHRRDRAPGKAGRWLLDNLRTRLSADTED